MENNLITPMIITTLAGISTAIGGIISILFNNRTNFKILGISLAFSAGIMTYISFVEILPKSREYFEKKYSEDDSYKYMTIYFFLGILIFYILNYIIFFLKQKKTSNIKKNEVKKILKVGIITSITMALHNFPEGFLTLISSMENQIYGISLGIAIALHNIPEGIAVASPIYYSSKNKMKAFIASLLCGIAEPIGAISGYLIINKFITNTIIGITLSIVAGLMVAVSLNELIPESRNHANDSTINNSFVIGMLVMAISMIFI